MRLTKNISSKLKHGMLLLTLAAGVLAGAVTASAECSHPNKYPDVYWENMKQHGTSYCPDCRQYVDLEDHKLSFTINNNYSTPTHDVICSVCVKDSRNVDCFKNNPLSYVKATRVEIKDASSHNLVKVCVCGREEKTPASHTFKNGKCTVCSAKEYKTPELKKISTAKSKRGKKYTKTYTTKSYIFAGTVYYYKCAPYKATYYKNKITASWKNPKGWNKKTDSYYIWITETNGRMVKQGFTSKKNKLSVTDKFGKKGTKYIISITPRRNTPYGLVEGKQLKKTIKTK